MVQYNNYELNLKEVTILIFLHFVNALLSLILYGNELFVVLDASLLLNILYFICICFVRGNNLTIAIHEVYKNIKICFKYKIIFAWAALFCLHFCLGVMWNDNAVYELSRSYMYWIDVLLLLPLNISIICYINIDIHLSPAFLKLLNLLIVLSAYLLITHSYFGITIVSIVDFYYIYNFKLSYNTVIPVFLLSLFCSLGQVICFCLITIA